MTDAILVGEPSGSRPNALSEAGWFEPGRAARTPIEIYASDASRQAIERAQRGLYRERAFRSLSPALRAKYFVPDRGQWRVSADLQRRIRWTTANLLSEADIRMLAAVPVIFCRNVFIYFSQDAILGTRLD